MSEEFIIGFIKGGMEQGVSNETLFELLKESHLDTMDLSPGAAIGGLVDNAIPAGLGGVIGYNAGEHFGKDPQSKKNFRRAGGAAGVLLPLIIQSMLRRQ